MRFLTDTVPKPTTAASERGLSAQTRLRCSPSHWWVLRLYCVARILRLAWRRYSCSFAGLGGRTRQRRDCIRSAKCTASHAL